MAWSHRELQQRVLESILSQAIQAIEVAIYEDLGVEVEHDKGKVIADLIREKYMEQIDAASRPMPDPMPEAPSPKYTGKALKGGDA